MAAGLTEDPRTSINWHHHKSGCPFYRERWFPYENMKPGEPLYQVFCMQNTPPVTTEEQNKCLHSRHQCWRLAEAAAKTRGPRPSQATKKRAANE